jgi:excisionase family DNA binding protein
MTTIYTIEQVAEYLQVSRSTVERLIRAGRIRVIYVGRGPRITERELEAFIGQRRSA